MKWPAIGDVVFDGCHVFSVAFTEYRGYETTSLQYKQAILAMLEESPCIPSSCRSHSARLDYAAVRGTGEELWYEAADRMGHTVNRRM